MSSAVVKTELGIEKICLKRERDNYALPAIASCKYIRKLLDIVQPDHGCRPVPKTEEQICLVFEWMEQDLRTVPSALFRENSNLPKIVAKSILSALALLKDQYSAIHTGELLPECITLMANISDINPNNIFLSEIHGRSPVVKVGDLGNSK
jgi:serine/threonine protein kinase